MRNSFPHRDLLTKAILLPIQYRFVSVRVNMAHTKGASGNRKDVETMAENIVESHDVFLCHNKADKAWVRRLGEQLESETMDGMPDGRPIRVFFDEWDIDSGQNLVLRIGEGLKNSRFFATIISPEFLAGPWPALEWTHVVAEDPTNRKGRLIPIFRRDISLDGKTPIDLPAPFKALAWLDFRLDTSFRKEFQKLIRRIRGLPPPRGTRRSPLAALAAPALSIVASPPSSPAAPDRISEVILGNLLPVETFPLTVWSAPTTARKAEEVTAVVPSAFAFDLQEQRLFTFVDLNIPTEPLRAVVNTNGIRPHSVVQWKNEPPHWNWFITLMHRCLRNFTGKLPIRRDIKGRYFFLPCRDGSNRDWSNGQDRPRAVAALKTNMETGESFYVHQSAWLTFQTLGESLFLSVEPSYIFTSDGRIPLAGRSVGPLTMQWAGKERNAAILRHVVFWGRSLSLGKSKIIIPTGGPPIIISGIPALARTTFGIEFDHIGINSLIAQVEDELGQAANTVQFNDSQTPGTNEEEEDAVHPIEE